MLTPISGRIIYKNYIFKNTHISEFRFVNDTTSTFTIQTDTNGNEISVQNIVYTPAELSEGEEFTINIERITKVIGRNRNGRSKTITRKYKYTLTFVYSKFSDAYAQIKASNLSSLQESDIIQSKGIKK